MTDEKLIEAAEELLRMEAISSSQWRSLSRKIADFVTEQIEARSRELTAEVEMLRELVGRYEAMATDSDRIEFHNGKYIEQPCAQPEGSQCWHDTDDNLFDSALEAYEAVKEEGK